MIVFRKKDGSPRLVIDYRRLNEVTEKDVYLLPRMDEVLESLGNAKYFSMMDLTSRFYKILIE